MTYAEQFEERKQRREAFAAWMAAQGFTPEQSATIDAFVEAETGDAYDDGAAGERESRL